METLGRIDRDRSRQRGLEPGGQVRAQGGERRRPASPRRADGVGIAVRELAGKARNEATDIYALGVTLFRAFTGEFPYGNADAVSPPRRSRPTPLSALRPDLPAWLEAALARAVAVDPAERFHDMIEFAMEMETGPEGAPLPVRRPRTLYERNPLPFWQGAAALLALALLLSLLRH